MIPKLTEAKYISGYRIWLKFEDGKEGEVGLEKELWGEIFEAVRDEELFKQFRVDPELNTLIWPNGADFAPEYLYRQVSA